MIFEDADINSLNGELPDMNTRTTTIGIRLPEHFETPDGDVLWYRGFLKIDEPGLYWFRTSSNNRACLGINQQLILDQFVSGKGTQGSVQLEAGFHELDMRFLLNENSADPSLEWVPPGLERWRWNEIPEIHFQQMQEISEN